MKRPIAMQVLPLLLLPILTMYGQQTPTTPPPETPQEEPKKLSWRDRLKQAAKDTWNEAGKQPGQQPAEIPQANSGTRAQDQPASLPSSTRATTSQETQSRRRPSKREDLDLNAAIPILLPQRCSEIPDGRWECVQALLRATAQGKVGALKHLPDPSWNGYVPAFTESFRTSCGAFQGVWKYIWRGRRILNRAGWSAELGALEFERCMIRYSVGFTAPGNIRSFEIDLTPPRLDRLSESESVQADMRTVIGVAGDLLLLADKGNLAAVQLAMQNKGFSEPNAEKFIKLARFGHLGSVLDSEEATADFGEMRYCGFGSGEKNSGNKGIFGVYVTCVYDDWFRSFSIACTAPGACKFTGTVN